MPTNYKGTEEEVLALNAFITFHRAFNSMQGALRQHLKEVGLTPSQIGVMEALYHLGPMCQHELASKILKSGGNLTLVLDNLSRDGWVERKADAKDRRKYQVHLTPQGAERMAAVMPEHAKNIAKVFAGLNAEEKKEFAGLCRKLGRSITEKQT